MLLATSYNRQTKIAKLLEQKKEEDKLKKFFNNRIKKNTKIFQKLCT